MNASTAQLQLRVTDLTEAVGKLMRADAKQRACLVAMRRYLMNGYPDDPRRVRILENIEEVLGRDGCWDGDPNKARNERRAAARRGQLAKQETV